MGVQGGEAPGNYQFSTKHWLNGEPLYTPRDFNGGSRFFPFPAKKITAKCRGPPLGTPEHISASI